MLLLLLGLQAVAVYTHPQSNNEIVRSKSVDSNSWFDTEVRFYLYTRKNPSSPIELRTDNLKEVNPFKRVKFLVHGWVESRKRPYYENFTREYLEREDLNFIQVDWSGLASFTYVISAYNTRIAGARLGRFIANLHGSGVPLDYIHILGHSLGGHVAGFAGKEVYLLQGVKIARITGLDPAGPLFEGFNINENNRLSRNDAKIVDVVHTDGGVLGYKEALGTIDYFPNGGTPLQPGCIVSKELDITSSISDVGLDVVCGHSRSYHYYIESINQSKFEARACESWEKFKKGDCDNNIAVPFGTQTSSQEGKYYFRTNSKSPFARPLNQ